MILDNETLDAALKRFTVAMKDKFQARAYKHGERSVTKVGDSVLREPKVFNELINHLISEVIELLQNYHSLDEHIDVANMAFLLWWHDNPK